ncbi:MAG: hypothetical protein CVT67_04020 [Actinobacteria bacterium HGW-Actinobacteria-7]|jgi:hypothetical protein|nr:MAG: hypothetical protein CVT67_04020 [Actinobacteria bacterium HGW-Actinobacteria-7]
MNTRRIGISAAALAIAAFAVMGTTGCTTKVVTAPSGGSPNSVTASGSGRVSATPDEATMNFGVNATSKNAQTALDQASAAAKKITSALAKQGVDKKDIQTSGVNLYPQQDSSSGRIQITGYDANISVDVKLRDLSKVGDVITAAGNAGATSISGPSFQISEDSDFRASAIEKAVTDARKNAEAMAKAAGKSVGDVISISGSNVNVPGPLYDMAGAAKVDLSAGSVPVEPGQLDVTADITVVFELK